MSVLPYGVDSKMDLDLPPEVMLSPRVGPCGHPLSDVASAINSALSSPLDFPAVERMVVPGDKVTLALSAGLAQAPILVRSVINRLTSAGITLEDITVLRPPLDAVRGRENPYDELSSIFPDNVTFLTHDPKKQTNLAHLGISPYRHPVYLNRALVEADVVILLGAMQLESTLAYHGILASLYPTYADEPVLRRFRSPKAIGRGDTCDHRIGDEVEMINRQLGVRFTVQIVPGLGEEIVHVLAGDIDAVAAQGQSLCQATWSFDVPRRATLVVATISGPAWNQTWENVGCALSNAMAVVEESGAVVICTDLEQPLAPGMQAIADHDDPQDAVPWIRRTRPVDIAPAIALTQLLSHARVYLLSNQDESLVEDLGMAVVGDASEVARLASRHASCVLLADAHRMSVRVVEV